MSDSRVQKSIQNAKISFISYFGMLIISFFSRKIFLDTLGPEFMGLTGTLHNILGMMSLAEMGISTSICFHLYKPVRENNHEEICKLLSLFGWLYRLVGLFMLAVAVIVSCFFPFIFHKTEIPLHLIYFVFFSFLGSSLIGYFINYRQLLLTADQRHYVVSGYTMAASIVKVLIQMFCCYYFLNYYLWAIIELVYGVVTCIILNWKINQTYPWLKTKKSLGKMLNKEYPDVLKSTKQIFIHKIKDFILGQSDQILVFAFVSLKYVAYYGNYSMLTVRLIALLNSVMTSAEGGVGNLVAEGDEKKISSVFWELQSMRFLFAGIITVVLYFVFPPFITVWIGEEYLLSPFVTFLICLNMFILITRTSIDAFNHAYGQYADVWAAWAEAIVNLTVTILVASQIGIAGILLGKIVSMFFLVVLWKPYYLFHQGFHKSYWNYWKYNIVYYILLIISIVFVYISHRLYPGNPNSSWGEFVIYGAYIGTIFSVIYFVLLYFFSTGFKAFTHRIINQVTKKKK